MSSNYTGNSEAVESPNPAPQPGQPPIITLPADTDGATWGNIYQPHKAESDEIAYLKSGLWNRYQEDFMLPSGVSITGAPVSNYGRLSTAISGGTVKPFNSAAGGNAPNLASRSCQTSTTNSINVYSYWCTSSALAHFTTTLIFVLDINVMLAAVSAAANNFFVGLVPDGSVGWTSATPPAGSLGIQITGGQGPWVAYGASSNTNISATYNPTANNWQRFRLEYFGAATPQGIANTNTAFTRYSLSTPNSSALVQVASLNGAPTGGDCAVAGGVTSSAAGNVNFYCSSWIAQWNPWGY